MSWQLLSPKFLKYGLKSQHTLFLLGCKTASSAFLTYYFSSPAVVAKTRGTTRCHAWAEVQEGQVCDLSGGQETIFSARMFYSPFSNNGFPFTGHVYHLVVAGDYEMLNQPMNIITFTLYRYYIFILLYLMLWLWQGEVVPLLSLCTHFLSCETFAVAIGGK